MDIGVALTAAAFAFAALLGYVQLGKSGDSVAAKRMSRVCLVVFILIVAGSFACAAVQCAASGSSGGASPEAAGDGGSSEGTEEGDGCISVEVAKEIDPKWGDEVRIVEGERAACKVTYVNDSGYAVGHVMFACVLTDNLRIAGGATVSSAAHPDGVSYDDFAENAGIDIGSFGSGETAEALFYLEPANEDVVGVETVTASVTVNGEVFHESARVEVERPSGGWGDNTNGRSEYTSEEVESGALGNTITFNSISDGKVGREFDFVSARKAGESGEWCANLTEVEDGEVYRVRLYVRNDNPGGYDALAKGVTVTYSLPRRFSKAQTVVGYLDSSNAIPSRCWDTVTFKSDRYFYIEYLDGSARLWTDYPEFSGGVALTNDIIHAQGATIGYNALDGLVPGGEEYDCVVTIDVRVHMKG